MSRAPGADPRRTASVVLGGAAALSVALVGVRAEVLGLTEAAIARLPITVVMAIVGAHRDLLVVAGCAALLVGALWLTRRPAVHRAVVAIGLVVGLGLLLTALGNVKAVEILGGPVNYPWLYYSDFLGSPQTRLSVLHDLTWHHGLVVAGAVGVVVGLGVLLRPLAFRLLQSPRGSWGAAAGLALYFAASGWYLHERARWDPPRLANPVVAFVGSMFVDPPPEIFTMDTPVEPTDFLPVRERRLGATPEVVSRPSVRNVVLFVMESVAAQYTDPYGGGHGVTPVLTAHREHSLTFRYAYSHVPSSSKALVALLGSRYPQVSYLTTTKESPDVPMATLSDELARRGHRTGFFFSADTRYQGIEDYLAPRSFDVVQDHRTRPCDRSPYANETLPFADGSDDQCTVTSLLDWVDEAPDQPFFGVVWTMMTHYPYFQPSEAVEYDLPVRSEWDEEHLNRYLNALRHGDAALGTLLAGLSDRGLTDSTLVVVVGDHGEAFGQHGQYGHGSSIYEENVHVPLVLINPTLFSGEDSDRIGGLIDIAPTVTDLLGLPPAPDWQGQSLVSAPVRERTYFFSTWKERAFGYREGDFKYIYNASRDSIEAYDLTTDPDELHNLVDEMPEVRGRVLDHLAAWVQYEREAWAEASAR